MKLFMKNSLDALANMLTNIDDKDKSGIIQFYEEISIYYFI
jgi:hypothetical protein